MKKNVMIRIDKEVIHKAKELGLNISKVSENALKRAVAALEQTKPQNETKSAFLGEASFGKEGSVEPRAGFEPATSALPRQCPTS
jgi:post-segregation antitoxin (ccd killing protein)